MRFCHPCISGVFDIDGRYINTAVIENRKLLCEIIFDIHKQTEGLKGKAVLSDKDKILDFSKNAELLSSFIPFDMNKKALITKIISAIEKQSVNPEHYSSTMKILADTEKYLDSLASDFDCNILYSKITPSALIKAVGIEIVDDYDNLAEKVIDYMELVREFDREKLFITVNMRCFIDDNEAEQFMKTALEHEYNVLMIESNDYPRLQYENRITVDEDLCEF